MILSSIKEFQIQHDAPLDLLRVEWTGGKKMNRFQEAFGQLLKLTKQLQMTLILLDITSLPDIPVFDQLWLTTHFMPGVLGLPLQRVVVVIGSKHVYNQHVVEGLLTAVRPSVRFDVQFFTHADAGMHWLTDDALQLPALLAEWEPDRSRDLPATTGSAELRAPRAR